MVETKFAQDRYGGIEINDLTLLPNTEEEFDLALTTWIE
jgi:hypothetical protein